MKLIVDIPENDEQPGTVLRRRLTAGQVIQVQGFQATVVGEIDRSYRALVPYLTVEGA